jgi:hypothetical protein
MKTKFITFCSFSILLSLNIFAQSTKTNIKDWKPYDVTSYTGTYTISPEDLFYQASDQIKFEFIDGNYAVSYSNEELTNDIIGTNLIIDGSTFSFIINNANKQVVFKGKFISLDYKENWGEGKIDYYHNRKGIMVDDKTFYLKDVNTVVSSSSVLVEKNKDAGFYKAENLLDHNYSTAWVEGVAGTGIGQYLTMTFYKNWQPSELHIVNGYAKNDAIYQKNSRPKQLKLTFSDGTTQTIDLKDIMTEQIFSLNIKNKIGWVKVEISDVYKGTAYEDTCITEIEFN